MFPYFLVLSLVVSWVILIKKAFNRKAFWFPLITLALFSGIRSSSVGTDSGNYVWQFIAKLDVNYFNFRENIEPGFQLLTYFLLHFTHNYFWLFFISGLIVVYCYLYIIKKYSTQYWLSIFLFITLGCYTYFFNGLRQGLSMAIFTLATPYLLDKRPIPYFIICTLASLFHTSALAMLPFYFLVQLRINLPYKIIATFFISLFSSRLIINYLAQSNDRYAGYTEASEYSGGLLTLIFYIIIAIFLYFIGYYYKIKNQIYTKLLTFYICGVTLVIPIVMLGTAASGPQRILSYFTWSIILLFPIALKKINNFFITSFIVFLMFLYYFLTTNKFSNLTPYVINPSFEFL